jgi:multicomponent Na+:H+ antiporter subunit E
MTEKNSQQEKKSQAQAALKNLKARVRESRIVCPLCGAAAHARGLQARPGQGDTATGWQVVYICPSCGLMSRFQALDSALRLAEELRGSAWTAELRGLIVDPQEESTFEIPPKLSHHVAAFLISFLTWIVLIGNLNPVDLLWGAAVSLATAIFSARIAAVPPPHWILSPRRWLAFFALALEFVRQLIVQNVTLSLRVFDPRLPIRPGIVAIPTRLRNDVDLTILGSLMTLTPDTVTMDIALRSPGDTPPDGMQGMIYVHWINVQSTDPQKAYELVSKSLEDKLIHWLRE